MNNRKKSIDPFYFNVAPIKLTAGRKLKLHAEGWGLLTEYSLESVKINNNSKTNTTSSATVRASDRAGQITCVIRGPQVGLLFGLSIEEWQDVEKLCGHGQQLFYRYFKNGLSKNFGYEQKLFYNFCMMNQKNDVVVARFRRTVNMRNKFKSDVFLEIVELKKCVDVLFDLYVSQLRTSCDNPSDL